MKNNDTFIKKLYKMTIGDRFRLIVGETYEGTFLRVPPGWIYRYESRNACSVCFIPYTEDIQYWDTEVILKPCHWCKSNDIVLMESVSSKRKGWYIQCNDCGASSSAKQTKEDTIKMWNTFK